VLSEALQLIENKQFDEARIILLELIDQFPDDAEINFYCASTHDSLGLEREAIPYYEKAISFGIEGELRERAFVQLGSSYRCIGEYQKAAYVLEKGLEEFPNNLALQTFLAMALYNLKEEKKSVSILLNVLVTSSSDQWIKRYGRALKFYSENLDETW
jgi:tetratricopeptide (TPR) repeat protein